MLGPACRAVLGVEAELGEELGLASRLEPLHALPQAQLDEVRVHGGLPLAGIRFEALVLAHPGEVEDRDSVLIPAILQLQARHFVRASAGVEQDERNPPRRVALQLLEVLRVEDALDLVRSERLRTMALRPLLLELLGHGGVPGGRVVALRVVARRLSPLDEVCAG